MRAVTTIVIGTALAQLLSGCIIAAAPIAAGAALARSEAKRKKPPEAAVQKPSSGSTSIPAPKAAAPAVASPVSPATGTRPVTGSPPADTDANAGSAQFAPLIKHVRSRATLWQEGAPIKSLALDEKRTVLSPVAIDCQRRPPVVVIDLDPATADPDPRMVEPKNVAQTRFVAAQGWAASLAEIRSMDVKLVWVSAHSDAFQSALQNLLRFSSLDPNGSDRVIAVGAEGQNKQALRLQIARSACILAVVGDKRGDADEAYDYLRQPNAVLPIDSNWGEGWFLLPPPLGIREAADAE